MTRFRAGAAAILVLAAAALMIVALLPRPEALDAGGRTMLVRDVQLNLYTSSLQDRPTLAMNEDGSLVAAWESKRQEGGSYGVFARELDARGIARGGEIHVNETLAGHQQNVVLASDGSRIFYAWDSWVPEAGGPALMARADEHGETWLGAGGGAASAAALEDGRKILAWIAPERQGSRVMARLCDAHGAPMGDPIAVSQGGTAVEHVAGLDASGGGFRVAWSRESPGAGVVGVFARGFDAQGLPRESERLLAPCGIEPSLACAGDGRFVLAWMEPDGDHYRASARLFDAAGVALTPVLRPDEGALSRSGVAAALREDGGFALAWNRLDRESENADILARLYDVKGAALGGAFRATSAEEGAQMLAVASGAQRLAYGDAGRLALAWAGKGAGEDASAVHLSLLLPEASLADRAAWAMSELRLRSKDAPAGESFAIAQPHVPPTYEEPGEPVFESEVRFEGDLFRDEGFRFFTSTGWTPPDPHAAVGAEHVVGMVNGGIACWTKDGSFLWQANISGNAFWNAYSFVFDPEVIYDPHSGRFMAMACERGDDGHSYFDFAVSVDGTPTNSTSEWHKYRFDVTSWSDNDIDSPNMAVTAGEIYLTADFFGPDKYGILIIDKSSVLGGGTAVTTHYLHNGTQSHGLPVVYDAGTPMFMLEDAENSSSSSLKIYAIRNPLTTPSLVNTTFPVSTYWSPIDVRSMGTSAVIETFESRFWSCVVREGKLWATHHICPTSARNTLAARWYEIDLNGWPDSGIAPSVVQSGNVLPGNTGYASFCSISVNEFGQAALNYTYSSTANYLDMYRSMRQPTDLPGTMQAPVLVKASSSSYSGSRWGDYSSVSVDPVDNRTFWSHGEYTAGGNAWSTWTSNFNPGGGTAADFPSYAFRVGGAWPNPTQGEARFSFELPAAARVSLDIFDVRGRRVRSLSGGEFGEGGNQLVWDGRDERGHDLPAGVYLARYEVGGRKVPGGTVTLIR